MNITNVARLVNRKAAIFLRLVELGCIYVIGGWLFWLVLRLLFGTAVASGRLGSLLFFGCLGLFCRRLLGLVDRLLATRVGKNQNCSCNVSRRVVVGTLGCEILDRLRDVRDQFLYFHLLLRIGNTEVVQSGACDKSEVSGGLEIVGELLGGRSYAVVRLLVGVYGFG